MIAFPMIRNSINPDSDQQWQVMFQVWREGELVKSMLSRLEQEIQNIGR